MFRCLCAVVLWLLCSVGVAQSINFDGTDDYLEVADVDLFSFGDGSSDNPFSVSCWIRPVSLASAGNYMFVSKRYDTVKAEWWLGEFSSGQVNFTCGDGATFDNRIGRITSSVVLSDNTWYHLVGTYSGNGSTTGFKIYLDGAQVDDANDTAGTYVAMENGTANVRVGAYRNSGSNPADPFNGRVDDVRIYDSELTANQVKILYQHGRRRANKRIGGILATFVGGWEITGASGTDGSGTDTIRDVSGSGNHADGVDGADGSLTFQPPAHK